jgi:predicted nucleic acid-binding protein
LKFLLDASAILPLLTRTGRNLIVNATQTDLIITDLAIYEACNGLWKLATLLKTISLQNAQELVTLLDKLTTKNLVQTINFTMIDLLATLNLAQSNRLTFYDASYIVAAQGVKGILVTEDQKLCKTANSYVKTISFAQLEKEFVNRA